MLADCAPAPAARIAIALVALAGCLHAASTPCGGGVCPPGLRCVNADTAPLCVLETCGNGHVDPGEACDDGNNASGDSCPADCGPSPCGNHRVDPGEQCDDGNTLAGDGCSPTCQLEACGNGHLDPGEQCDDGNLASHDGCSARCTAETDGWTALDAAPDPRDGHALAYDAVHLRVVLFGGRGAAGPGRETWEWDGAVWRRRDPATVPPPRTGHTMAYDAARQRVVMFGGGAPGEQATWTWDGVDWTQIPQAAGPPSQLVGAAMVYDAAHQRIVLFGGLLDTTYQAATWAWDGTSWQAIATASPPPGRAGHAMVYDEMRGVVVLFGGIGDAGRLADTWELGDAGWAQRSTTDAPPARAHAAATFDPASAHAVVFGGDSDAGPLTDTWLWDGSRWTTPTADTASPTGRAGAAMVYDLFHRAIVLFGGNQTTAAGAPGAVVLSSETWTWNDGFWTDRTIRSRIPPNRQAAGMVRDPLRGTLIGFGGLVVQPDGHFASANDTWEWNGSGWRQLPSVNPPPGRSDFAIGFDGHHVVVFGGAGDSGLLNDTWVLIGERWIRQTTPVAPSPRAGAAMAYDAGRGVLVLFGGHGVGFFNANVFRDTWEWDGAQWTLRTPSFTPFGRWHHAMAYDDRLGRVVVFGGDEDTSIVGFLFDSWSYDGTTWAALPGPTSPTDEPEPMMDYDAARGCLVLFTGVDTWEWCGSDWQKRSPATTPVTVQGRAMAYDTARGRSVLFSNNVSAVSTGAVWQWDGSDWQLTAPHTGVPPGRIAGAMVHDTALSTTLVFGGSPGVPSSAQHDMLGDTWLWDGDTWQAAAIPGPPPRMLHAMAYDSARDAVVLFGGFVGATACCDSAADTWEWHAGAWREVTPAHSPPLRNGHAMVYDAARHQTLMLGGVPGEVGPPYETTIAYPIADQWAWDGTAWTQLAAPPMTPRSRLGLAYDPDRQRAVLFGGLTRDGAVNDTWEWDGATWTERIASGAVGSPTARFGHTMVYDQTRHRTMLLGGYATGAALDDLWEWDGTAWHEVAMEIRPPARVFHAMAYDAAHGELVVTGGGVTGALGDAWLFRQADLAVPDVPGGSP